MSAELEARLQKLISANLEENRTQWAKRWQQDGGKVFGILCSYVPVEILVAANVLPFRISGTWSSKIDDALVLRAANSCGYCNHVLQSLLDGQFDFLDGVVSTTWEQDGTRLYDVWDHLGKSSFRHILHLPHRTSDENVRYFASDVAEFRDAVQAFTGSSIANADVQRAIQLCNQRRSLVKQLYELRKQAVPPLSGTEMLGVTVAGTIMPVQTFNDELTALLPYLRERKAAVPPEAPRILISSDFIDNPAWIEAVESLGCLVAMDDLDTGSRYYALEVKSDNGDPLHALASRYLRHPGSARMAEWNTQLDYVVEAAGEFRCQGVLEFAQRYSRAREMRRPYFLRRLQEAGIPAISLEKEYPLNNLGQIRTRAQAFLEMLEVG